MNYYSRNSPKKRKVNLPPGFLIPTPLIYSEQSTPRSKLKSHFNLTSRHSTQSQYDPYQKQEEILVLDDDVLYVPNHDQILIQEDEQEGDRIYQEPRFASQSQNVGELFEYITPPIDSSIDINIQKEQKFHQTQPISKTQIHQHTDSHPNKIQDKYFFRNYSFGDKEFTKNQQVLEKNKKQPLIRQLVNMQPMPILETRTRRNRNKLEESQFSHHSQNNKNVEHKSLKGRVQVEQGWSKIVKNFIKKRSSEKNQETNIQVNSEQQYVPQVYQEKEYKQIKPQSDDHSRSKKGKRQEKIPAKKLNNSSSKKEESQSLQSQTPLKKLSPSNSKKESRLLQSQLASKPSNNPHQEESIKIQQDQQDQQNPPHFSQQPQVFIQQHDFSTSPISSSFQVTTNMLDQIIQVLPSKLVPKYVALKNQLERKQYQAQITINRMQETQRMLKMLIQTHQKKIYADDYILDEQTQIKSEIEEKIVVNRQIIMSLVRKLALY